ncbi:MAG TPA: hypothetical protein VGY48_15340 [Vicinamibacterales bacterium]|jgi:hypothetical protein|nr:hypothetical protein [Vicinamibacterales bacterium]
MILECICDVEGCGEHGRLKHGQLPAGWVYFVVFEKRKLPRKIPQFPVDMEDMVMREQMNIPRMRKRAVCGKHELPKLVIYDGEEDDESTILGGGLGV